MPEPVLVGGGQAGTAQWWPAVGVVGIAPLLVCSTTLITGLFMSMAWLSTLVLATAGTAAIRPLVPLHARFAFLFLITATWVTLIDLALQAWAFPVSEVLGVYVPLLAVNGLLVAEIEQHALVEGAAVAVRRAARVGVAVALFVSIAGAVRELAATGSLLSDLSSVTAGGGSGLAILPVRLPVLAAPAGAFLVFALLAAAMNRLDSRR